MVNLFQKQARNLQKLDEEALLDLVQESQFLKARKGQFVEIKNGGYIFKGEIMIKGQKISKFHEVYPAEGKFQVRKPLIYIIF